MAIADIKNSKVRKTIIVAVVPFVLVIYAIIGASLAIFRDFVDDLRDAWKGSVKW